MTVATSAKADTLLTTLDQTLFMESLFGLLLFVFMAYLFVL
jgi:hypothetical protein